MRRKSTTTAFAALREAINETTLRALMHIRDTGENLLAKVKNATGGSFYDTTGDGDVWVHYVDDLSGYSGMARLHIPGGILYSLPEEDDSCMVVRPRDVNVPGGSYLLHGDGSADTTRFPSWIATAAGLFTKKILNLQSSDEDVKLDCGSGKAIKLGFSASKGVARQDDDVDGGNLQFLPNAGVAAAVLNYFPPGTPVIPLPGSVLYAITGKISSSSAKVKAED